MTTKAAKTAAKKALDKAKANAPKAAKANEKAKANQEAKEKSKALTLVVSDTAGKGNTLAEVDMSIEGAMPFNQDTTGNKAAERLFAPSQANIDEVMRLVNHGNISIELESVGRDIQKLQWKLAHMAVAIAYKLQQDGQDAVPLALEFLKKLEPLSKEYSILRSVSMRDWLLKYAPVDWAEPNNTDKKKTLVFSSKKRGKFAPQFGRNKQKFVSERLEKPFFLYKKQADPQDYDLKKAIRAVYDKVLKIKDMTPAEKEEKFNELHMEGQKKFLEFCQEFLSIRKDKGDENNDNAQAEEKEEEQNIERVA